MPIARCCTATRRNCARCARLTGSKRCISVLRGAFWGKGWGTLALPHPPPRKCYAPLSLSLSHLLPCPANLLVRRSPPKRLESTTQSGNAVGPVLSSDLPQHPSSHPFSLFRFTLARSLARSLLPPPPAAPTPPLRFAHLPRTDVPDQPLLPPRFLSFFLSLSFAQREVVFSSRDLSVQHRPLFAAPLLKGVKVLFVSFLLFFLYVMLEFWRDSERSK